MKSDLLVLKDRSVLALLTARSVSLLGNAIMPIALAFAILEMPGGSATVLGLVLATRMVTQLLFVLLGGVFADRLPKQRLMIGADVAAGSVQTVAALLLIAGAASPVSLAGLAALSGAAAALFEPASRSVMPALVDGDSLQSANALLKLSMRGGSILGAVLGGVLVAVMGAGRTLLVDAGTFFVSALLLTLVRTVAPVAKGPAKTMLAALREGWQEFTARRWVWVMVTQMAVVNVLLAGSFYVLGPVVAKETYGGAPGWSTVVTVQAIGFVAGTLVAMRIRPARPIRVAALATAGFPLSLFLLAAQAPLAAVCAAAFASAIFIDVYEVMLDTTLQKNIPPEALSRVMSYETLGTFALVPLGSAVVGPVSGALGVGPTLSWAGALIVAAGVVTFLLPSIRALPPVKPEALEEVR
ncbi:MFS transporter [Streptomyces sp. NPDC086777]|uniref:MFS transporter n=1 Tax=Streptomyces sp. NPDC086777 TaxID=3154866 RepID=UPI0034507F9B